MPGFVVTRENFQRKDEHIGLFALSSVCRDRVGLVS